MLIYINLNTKCISTGKSKSEYILLGHPVHIYTHILYSIYKLQGYISTLMKYSEAKSLVSASITTLQVNCEKKKNVYIPQKVSEQGKFS